MHYANGPATGCSDIWKLSEAGSPGYVQQEPCTDVNSTMWLAAAVARCAESTLAGALCLVALCLRALHVLVP